MPERFEGIATVIDHLQEGIQVLNADWRYVYVNAAAATHGRRTREELIGRTIMEAYPGIEATPVFGVFRRVMDEGRTESLRNHFTYPDGDSRWFELVIDPVPSGICIVSTDVTDRVQAEERERHYGRMEALGQLAGGVAHDFNNQLTAILGFAELAVSSGLPAPAEEAVNAIRDAALRSASLTKRLLAFSRRQPLLVESRDLNEIVRHIEPLLTRLLGEAIAYTTTLVDIPVVARIDVHQLENVIANLAVNARDAMPDGGRLAISTALAALTDDDAMQHPGMKAGRYAVISVSDTGHGMDKHTQARLFDPFFTTKPPGKGTGLGLATVYGVVKQMGGFIWVYSEVNEGTTFRLYFPLSDDAPVASVAAPPVSPAAVHDGGTVLIVEDSTAIRELIRRTLERYGYRPVAVETPSEARAWLRGSKEVPHLLLVDVVLAGESGPDFVRSLPFEAMPVVFMSGYSPAEIERRGVPSRVTLLEKPFTGQDLLRAVRTALAQH